MQPLVVPKLAAAAIGLGIGAAVFAGAGAASAAPSDSSSDSSVSASSASDSSAKSVARDTKATRHGAGGASDAAADNDTDDDTATDSDDIPSDDETDGADAAAALDGESRGAEVADDEESTVDADIDRDTVAVEAATDETAAASALRRPKPPTPVQIIVDKWLASAARGLGYAPVDPDAPTQPVNPVRTWLADALAALQRARDENPANETPSSRPVKVHQFVTGEVLGDLRARDADGDALTYHVLDGPASGALIVNANGTYYYKPTSEFAETGGRATYYVAIDDSKQGRAIVPVIVTVAPTLGVTERFWFRNYTLAPLKFNGYSGGTEDLDGGPAVGTVILPGGERSWDVTWYLFSVGSVTPQFGTVGFGATPSSSGYVPEGYQGTTFQVTYKTKPRETQCSAGGGGQCSVPNDKMAIALDKSSPTITLGAADAAKIAAVLPNICYDGSIANCSFIAKGQTAGFSPVRTVGTPVTNTTSTPTTTSVSIADTVSQTDTVGVSVKLSGGGLAKLASIINLEITANYQHSWTKTTTFTQTINVPVGAGRTAWIEGSVPVWKVTGDFTVRIGNSTYQLNDAIFDTPNPDEQGSYVIRDKPATLAPVRVTTA